METFQILNDYPGQTLHTLYDKKSGLRAFIAFDGIEAGRSVGGIRCLPYDSEEAALREACKLAQAMALKAKLAGLACGGAKTVMIKHPKLKRKQALRALGRAIDALGGLYHSGSDVGIDEHDLGIIAEETVHVSHKLDFGGYTAHGVFAALRSALSFRYGSDDLKEIRVGVQGLGKVGMRLVSLLAEAGAKLIVADHVEKRCKIAARDFGAQIVSAQDIIKQECDVLAPCALGGVIQQAGVPHLKCQVLVGSANNLLAEGEETARALKRHKIIYVPDYISSAGALIAGVTMLDQPKNQKEKRTSKKSALLRKRIEEQITDRIYSTTLNVLQYAQDKRVSTLRAAQCFAAS